MPTRRVRMVKILATALPATFTLILAGCGQPEDTRIGVQAAAPVVVSKVLPPFPAWSQPLIGKPLSEAISGRSTCKGVFDVVVARHEGPHGGVELAGWAWDSVAKQPVSRVLFVDTRDRVIGAADGGQPRADVAAVLPEVKTQNSGWRGPAAASAGDVRVIAITAHGAGCDIGVKNVAPS